MKSLKSSQALAGRWWLMPVILATQEAESRANSSQDPILKITIIKRTGKVTQGEG
jgi:hypothetical protein